MTPAQYDQDIAFAFCDYVAGGMSVEQVCRQPRMPTTLTFYQWIGQHPEFRMAFDCAFRVRFGLTSEQLREAKEAHDRRIAAAWRDDRMLTDTEALDALIERAGRERGAEAISGEGQPRHEKAARPIGSRGW